MTLHGVAVSRICRLFSLRCANRASFCASAAVNTSVSVNHIFSVAVGNSANGAAVCTCAAGNALVTDFVSHG